jgi:hypothetical protein
LEAQIDPRMITLSLFSKWDRLNGLLEFTKDGAANLCLGTVIEPRAGEPPVPARIPVASLVACSGRLPALLGYLRAASRW